MKKIKTYWSLIISILVGFIVILLSSLLFYINDYFLARFAAILTLAFNLYLIRVLVSINLKISRDDEITSKLFIQGVKIRDKIIAHDTDLKADIENFLLSFIGKRSKILSVLSIENLFGISSERIANFDLVNYITEDYKKNKERIRSIQRLIIGLVILLGVIALWSFSFNVNEIKIDINPPQVARALQFYLFVVIIELVMLMYLEYFIILINRKVITIKERLVFTLDLFQTNLKIAKVEKEKIQPKSKIDSLKIGKIKESIGKGNLTKAIEELKRLNVEKDLSNDILLLSSNFERIKGEYNKGLISGNDYELSYSKVVYRLLSLLKKIE